MNSKRFGITLPTLLLLSPLVCCLDIFPAGTEYKPERGVASPQVSIYGQLVPEGPYSSQQRHFSAEVAGVDLPVAIPQDVLAILRNDQMVRNGIEDENLPAEKMPPSWFSASAIHLSNSSKVDLVVVAQGPLAGANVTTFWVFRATSRGYELVLTAPAHDLAVMNTRWKGYRDIELISLTGVQISTVLCRFDGKRYKAHKTSSEPIR